MPANTQKDDYNVRFRESYADLTNQIAYRFPNPGLPRYDISLVTLLKIKTSDKIYKRTI
jgi:hypothetical protein